MSPEHDQSPHSPPPPGPWSPAVPLKYMVWGRIFLGFFEWIVLSIIVGVWSPLSGADLDLGRVLTFSAIAIIVRETLDGCASRVIMRVRRTNDPQGIPLAALAFTSPVLAGLLGSRAVAPEHMRPLTVLTWLAFAVLIIVQEQPWHVVMSHEEHVEAGRKVRLMTHEHFKEEIEAGTLDLPPIDEEGNRT